MSTIKTYCRFCDTSSPGIHVNCPNCGKFLIPNQKGPDAPPLPKPARGPNLTPFDQQLPIYVHYLLLELEHISYRASDFWTIDHECNCEHCEVKNEKNYIPADCLEEYNQLRSEALELAGTLDRCKRWAKLKGIRLQPRVTERSYRWMVPAEPVEEP